MDTVFMADLDAVCAMAAALRAAGVRRYSGQTPFGMADLELAPAEPESPGIVVSEVKPGQGEILTALNRLDALLKPNGAI